jgi:hypothetical protein
MKVKLYFLYLLVRIWLYKQYAWIAPYIGEGIYWVLCHLEDNWRVYLALLVGYWLGT